MFQKPVPIHYIQNNSTDMLASLFALALLSHHTNQQLWVRPLLTHPWPRDSFGISHIHTCCHHYSLVRDSGPIISVLYSLYKGCAIYSKFLGLSKRCFAITTGIYVFSILSNYSNGHQFEYGYDRRQKLMDSSMGRKCKSFVNYIGKC